MPAAVVRSVQAHCSAVAPAAQAGPPCSNHHQPSPEQRVLLLLLLLTACSASHLAVAAHSQAALPALSSRGHQWWSAHDVKDKLLLVAQSEMRELAKPAKPIRHEETSLGHLVRVFAEQAIRETHHCPGHLDCIELQLWEHRELWWGSLVPLRQHKA